MEKECLIPVFRHPHKIPFGKNGVDWWWDTPYGPDGDLRGIGPVDDDIRPVLVLKPTLTRERYVAWQDVAEFIIEVKLVEPGDVWVDMRNRGHIEATKGSLLMLCKEDTSYDERIALEHRGFTYLGSRGDVVYFENPYGKIDHHTYSDTYYDEPKVRIIISRSACFCLTYHRENAPGEWNWSRVVFDNKDPRPIPVQPPETPDDRADRLKKLEERNERIAQLREKAANGDGSAAFSVGIITLQENMQTEINAEVLKALQNARAYAAKYLDTRK